MSGATTRAVVFAAAWFAVLSALGHSAIAQGTQTGTLRGTVVDQQQQAVPGASITITSPALQGQRTTVSDADGAYVFRALPPGEYQVVFELASFATLERTVAVPLGGAVEHDALLTVASINESLNVSGQSAAPLATPTIGLNIQHAAVDALPTSRTLQGIATLSPGLNENTPNTVQVTINGAFAFDNVFMLNGVDVNDNLYGSPQNLFIEDAIQETQVLTSGISAEYGRFSGGVVNAITKSGGNAFSGSYRLNLTNPAWVAETPFERNRGIAHESAISAAHEATGGGPILRDRLWFFTAGRLASTSTANVLNQTGFQFTQKDDNERGEIKLTGSPALNHTIQGGYLNNQLAQNTRPSFAFSIDRFTLGDRTVPNWYAFGNYRGILRSTLLAEAQYSERRFGFRGSGGSNTALVDSPFVTVTQDLGQYNSRYFDASDPENRNNRQLTGNVTYFAERGGRHELKTGYEWFRSQHTGGNSQSPTGYVFNADYVVDGTGRPVYDASGHLVPIFVPGISQVQTSIAERGAILDVDNNSFYAQDHWSVNRQVSLDLGMRYERVRSTATGGLIGVDTDAVVPRLAAAYDVRGDGSAILHATYGHYSGRYNEAQIGANNNVSNPAEVISTYSGPPGQGRDFAPGFDLANYAVVAGTFPTANVSFEDGLSSPITREFTVSGGGALGRRAWGEVSYVWRRTTNLIDDFISLRNGATAVAQSGVDYGVFTNSVYRNTDLARRGYQGLVLQGRYNIRRNWTVDGNWTVQLKNDGNLEGEAANQPGLTSQLGDYPEVFNAERHYPDGRLPGFQRHRARIWTVFDAPLGRYGRLQLSGLLRADSGATFSYLASNQPLTDIQLQRLAAYPDAPSSQDIYFGARGAGQFDGVAVVDISANYEIPVFRSLRPWLKAELFNAAGSDRLIGYNTAVRPDPNSPRDALGLPTGFVRGPSFGQPQSNANFPGAQTGLGGEITRGRALRISLGVRF